MAQTGRDSQLWDCCLIGGSSCDRVTVAATSFATSSRVPFPLCNLVEFVARRNQARFARHGSLGSRLLLLPTSDRFIPCKAHRTTTCFPICGNSFVCLVGECCAEEGRGIDPARAR